MPCATRRGTRMCPSAQCRIWGPSLRRKNVLRNVSPRNTTSDDSLLRPWPTPSRSAGAAFPSAFETSSFAFSAASWLMPTLVSHPVIVSVAERSSDRI